MITLGDVMETLKKFKASNYAVIVVYMIIGLIMLLNPSFVSNAVNYILGILVIVYGIVYIISLYQNKETELYGKFDLLGGVLCISFGLFLIVNPDVLFSLIPFCTGVIIGIDAITQVIKSFTLKKFAFKRWWISLIIGGILLGFSAYIIINAKNISFLLIRIIGGFLIFDALADLITSICITKRIKKENDNSNGEEHKLIELKDE